MNESHRWTARLYCLKKFLAPVLAALCSILPQAATALDYPTRMVQIVVPAAPGGGLDQGARILAAALMEHWGQKVVVVNRPGANAIIGSEAVVHAQPDGYTLLLAPSGAITINPLVYTDMKYDPLRDLAPVMLTTASSFMLLVNNSVPAKTLQEFVAYLRTHPGRLNHASNSASTIISSEMLKAMAKVDYVDLNYRGAALAATSTMAGETQFCMADMGSATTALRSGLVRALALTAPQRSTLYPDIPTFSEAGVPGYQRSSWMVVLAPGATPPDLVAKINAGLKEVLSQPKTIKAMEELGVEVAASSVEETMRLLRADADQTAQLVKERHIKFQ